MKVLTVSFEDSDIAEADRIRLALTRVTGIEWSRAAVIRRALREFQPDELVYAAADGKEEDNGTD